MTAFIIFAGITLFLFWLAMQQAKQRKSLDKMDYGTRLGSAIKSGWMVISEGSSGAQLRKPMGGASKVCLLLGIILIWIPIICILGIILLVIGLAGLITSGQRKFVQK